MEKSIIETLVDKIENLLQDAYEETKQGKYYNKGIKDWLTLIRRESARQRKQKETMKTMKEFIEIPFGAKDSELGGWEYNIPEGYTASIENGKIIVKKKESEDEKIRKYLIDVVNDYCKGHEHDGCIAWLKKQGEQKQNPYSGTLFEYNGHTWGMCARDNGVDILLDKQLFKHLKKQGKSKFEQCVQKGDKIVTNEDGTHFNVSQLERVAKKEPNSSWSEEDEENLNQLHKLIVKKAYEEYEIDTEDETLYGKYATLDNWLKSLKDRVQSKWKPSEEELNALEYQVNSTYKGSWQYKASKELLEQLKKL